MPYHYLKSLSISLLTVCTALIISLQQAQAGVLLGTTRIIYAGEQKSAVINATNVTASDYAVQAWVNDARDDNSKVVPFMAMPAVFRLDAGQEQVIRILKTPGELPGDRESVFYFNAQEIPTATSDNTNSLKIALRTRVKLFYRPQGLPMLAADAFKSLAFKLTQASGKTVLEITNPSPYHITFAALEVHQGNNRVPMDKVPMLEPMSNGRYILERPLNIDSAKISYSTINDYGAYSTPLDVSPTN